MYIKEFNLKQHTPIIHFQSNDIGATLRASEVKPKLDKFLIKKLGGIKEVNDNYIEWLSDIKNSSFDYGINFKAKNSKAVKISNNHRNSPMYFGNMGDNKEKDLVFAVDGITMKIKTRNNDLLNYIEKYLGEFFSINNFGTRQSKGYGSFMLKDYNDLDKQLRYKFKLPINNPTDCFEQSKKILEKIDVFYKSLRSGFNLRDRNKNQILYLKPALFYYLNSLGIVWDKKIIKEAYINNNLQSNKYDYKDLFGLSSTERWKYLEARRWNYFTIKKLDESNKVSRFKSPLFFKPIIKENEAVVFFDILIPDYIGEYYGTRFQINANDRSGLILQIPEDFNYDKFLEFSFKLNIENNIESVGYGYAEKIKRSLMNTYNQLKEQSI